MFGGSGFIGRSLVPLLVQRGKRVRIVSRHGAAHNQSANIMSNSNNVQSVKADIQNASEVSRALEGAAGAINLVGLLYEKGKQTFEGVQQLGANNVAQAAAGLQVRRLVHVSAIGADASAEAQYARAKGVAEQLVLSAVPSATVLRPSIVFGPEDGFFNIFAQMSVLSPFLPLIGGGQQRYQPVSVTNVAEAIANALDSESAAGKIFELGGPAVYSFRELMEFTLRTVHRKRLLLPLPFAVAKPLGAVLDAVFRITPFAPPLTADQVLLLMHDNVVSKGARTLADLSVTNLQHIEDVVPKYLAKKC